jgi:hypothetical protein
LVGGDIPEHLGHPEHLEPDTENIGQQLPIENDQELGLDVREHQLYLNHKCPNCNHNNQIEIPTVIIGNAPIDHLAPVENEQGIFIRSIDVIFGTLSDIFYVLAVSFF